MATAAQTARRLREIAGRLARMAPILEVVAADVRLFIDDRFETSTKPVGEPWRELSPSTIARRRKGRNDADPKPLLDTGRLRRSITATVAGQGIRFGTNVLYAGAQNFGFGNIPARPFLPITPDGRSLAPQEFWARQRANIERWIKTGEIPS